MEKCGENSKCQGEISLSRTFSLSLSQLNEKTKSLLNYSIRKSHHRDPVDKEGENSSFLILKMHTAFLNIFCILFTSALKEVLRRKRNRKLFSHLQPFFGLMLYPEDIYQGP